MPKTACASGYTGKERDTETGLDYFGARYSGSTMGRFLSPDWSANQDPIPYADLEDPQSLNPRLSKSFDKLHRALNRQTDEVLRKLENDLGISVEDFNRGDFEQLGQRLQAAGEDVQAFNERMAALEPDARTFAQALGEALEEVFPAAADAVVSTGEAAGAAAGAAAETGVIP